MVTSVEALHAGEIKLLYRFKRLQENMGNRQISNQEIVMRVQLRGKIRYLPTTAVFWLERTLKHPNRVPPEARCRKQQPNRETIDVTRHVRNVMKLIE